ncbi:MAG TPA: nuclear transport factor 2 family protein [Candidatus Kapabacteria bacterium]|nr:nuclear transport factor 2 family protein [Candidatus Kapabacteria bacterium]
MIRIVAVLLVLWVVLLAVAVDKNAETDTAGADAKSSKVELSMPEDLASLDLRLFDAIFNDCDLPAVEKLLADNFEFIHDKGGLVATNASQFLKSIREGCERKNAGLGELSRRELVSMETFPLKNYGAIQTGVHRFFIIEPGKPDRPGDIAKFTHVWRKTGDHWKLARVLSYDHKAQN